MSLHRHLPWALLNVIETVQELKRTFSNIEVIAGNVATGKGAEDLINAAGDGRQDRHRAWFHLHDPHRGR
jgi:hypothetical protein